MSAPAELSNLGDVRWFAGYGPEPVVGPCPHRSCPHNHQSVVAWGPDFDRYELVTCDVEDGCDGGCRGWLDVTDDLDRSTPRGVVHRWLRVGRSDV
jgi:hypothetical protein